MQTALVVIGILGIAAGYVLNRRYFAARDARTDILQRTGEGYIGPALFCNLVGFAALLIAFLRWH